MSSNGNSSASTTSHLLPALHHALSGSTATLISTCTLYPLSQVITRLQAQRQLRREGKLVPGVHGPDPPSSLEDQTQHQRRHGQQQREYAGIVDAFQKIWSSDGDGGLKAFYTGLVPDAAKSALDSFLFFLFYEWFRGARLSKRGVRGKHAMLGALEELAIGIVAGACAKALTTPIANIASRKEAANMANVETVPGEINFREIVARIRKDKGVGGLWSGYSSNLLLTLNPSMTFYLQEFLKGRVSERRGRDPGAGMTFLLAATSKAISTLMTYPLQVAKTRLQAGIPIELPIDPEPLSRHRQLSVEISPTSTVSPHQQFDFDREAERKLNATRAVQKFAQQSVFGTMAQLVRNEGCGSLYDGLRGELLNSFLGHGTTMVVKEVMHRLLFRFYFFALGILAELRQRRASRQGSNAPEISPEVSPEASQDVSTPPPSAPAPELAPAIPPPVALPAPPSPPSPTPASTSPPASEHSPVSTPPSTPISTPAPAPAPIPAPAPSTALVTAPVTAPVAGPPALPPSSLPIPIPASSLPVPIPTPSPAQIQAEAPTRVISPAQIQGRAPSKIPLPKPAAPQDIPVGLRYRLEWDENRKRRGSRRGPDYGVNVVANLIDGTHRGLNRDRN
ncbi:mitochondrial carrier domain-containing protein [Biscogniauxia marginata]|nr:mitochondrial carrier domain-containing protein [Biscogniauxia marginata]